MLLTGKVYEATRRRTTHKSTRTSPTDRSTEAADDFVYDAVVMDAPPTGRIARFLNVNSEVASLARVGPVNRQAESIMRLIRSPQTVVHLVTMLEEMPVQETLDGIDELHEFDLPVGGVIVNRVHEPLLPKAESEGGRRRRHRPRRDRARAEVGRAYRRATRSLPGLSMEAERSRASSSRSNASCAAALRAAGRPTYQLADLDTTDIGRLYALAAELVEQGAA